MNKKWNRPWRWNWRTAESWHLHPIIVPEGSTHGALLWDDTNLTLPDGSIHTDKEIITDISWWYATNKRKSVIPPAYAGYKAKNIKKANHTWEKSGLKSYRLNLPNCVEGIRMFAESYDLASFTATDFKSLEHAEGMFEYCYQITTPPAQKDVFSGVKYASKMYKETGLTSFDLNMPNLESAVEMFYYCSELASYTTPAPSLINGSKMFYECEALTEQTIHFPVLENGNSMYQYCTKLHSFVGNAAKFPSLKTGRRMFRDSNKIVIKKRQDGTIGGNEVGVNEFDFPVLEDGLSLFQNCDQVEVIPCKFPELKNARQMFLNCKFSGHLELDFPTYFPKVGYDANIDGGDYPTAYMFGSCPITSIGFDFSTLDHGISMFNNCKQLTTCTKAVFMNGGNYQSTFSESRFDEASADIIIAAARAANVSILHIGMNSAYRTESFKTKHGCEQLEEGYDDQWKVTGTNIIIKWN
jgi:hypothetical protein